MPNRDRVGQVGRCKLLGAGVLSGCNLRHIVSQTLSVKCRAENIILEKEKIGELLLPFPFFPHSFRHSPYQVDVCPSFTLKMHNPKKKRRKKQKRRKQKH